MATSSATSAFAASAGTQFRDVHGLSLATIGIGTYLGNADDATDARYAESVAAYVRAGGNVVDTAANYRFQRSERAIGKAFEKLFAEGVEREALFVSTKGGYLPFADGPVRDAQEYFEREFVRPGHATAADLVQGVHCMAPGFLEAQIDRSLASMGLDAIDLFYIHNPETQLAAVDKYTFEARLAKAFERLERNRADGKIRAYGVATWNGFRVPPGEANYHSLERMTQIARQIGGDAHGFKFVQMPHNLAMPEALLMRNQAVAGKVYSPLDAAAELGVAVMCSASILQGKLAHSVPFHIRNALGNPITDAMTSIEFVRSTPGVATALVGMSRVAHVTENMALARVAPVAPEKFAELFEEAA